MLSRHDFPEKSAKCNFADYIQPLMIVLKVVNVILVTHKIQVILHSLVKRKHSLPIFTYHHLMKSIVVQWFIPPGTDEAIILLNTDIDVIKYLTIKIKS